MHSKCVYVCFYTVVKNLEFLVDDVSILHKTDLLHSSDNCKINEVLKCGNEIKR